METSLPTNNEYTDMTLPYSAMYNTMDYAHTMHFCSFNLPLTEYPVSVLCV